MSINADERGGVPPWGPTVVASVSRKDAVGIEIRRAIILGRLKPGDKLTETQLATSLGVSRPTVREALNQLTREGLIVQEPYRGLRVADVTKEQIRDIAVARVGLDMLAIDAILADQTGRRMQIVEEGWEQFERYAFHPDPVVQHEAHLAFHRQIWAASENYLLLKLWPVTEAHITLAIAEDQTARDDPERAHRVHADLMVAIRTKDRDTIEAAFVAHTLTSAEELITLLGGEETQ
ncbi:GntR family transcriptional regulator [Agromyces luteolus]|uniref:GntR family transcriptional regulator n=1 Tax=Agromyces luteolus TaxID=88373 RepID=A0A7C9MJ10_9MICO|nr:GntR family transcriptional regulator [Agromyces luteolus]MUN08278.1 GntR family transcriptional regulator [Agromyces luteolus]GLK26811.1 GntR family transcriptional regulator [Agromyces luteolus]